MNGTTCTTATAKRLTPDEQREIVAGHLPFAVSIVRRYFPRLRGHELQEAVAASSLGLVLAARRFNPDLGFAFMTYATSWCRQCVSQQRQAERRRGFRKFPADGGIVASLNLSRGSNEIAFVEDLHAKPEADPDAHLDVEELLAVLPDRQREIVRALCLAEESSVDVAARFGVSRERIRQVKVKAFARIRETFGITV